MLLLTTRLMEQQIRLRKSFYIILLFLHKLTGKDKRENNVCDLTLKKEIENFWSLKSLRKSVSFFEIGYFIHSWCLCKYFNIICLYASWCLNLIRSLHNALWKFLGFILKESKRREQRDMKEKDFCEKNGVCWNDRKREQGCFVSYFAY